MTRRIGILNYKGGTAKTTTVVNLGAALAMKNARVLGIDLDPQGSLATCLGVKYEYSLRDLLLGLVEPNQCIAQARKNFDIIASDSALLEAEGEMWRMNDVREARKLLDNKLKQLNERYDYVLIDFSPSVSILSESGLRYIREIIVPVSTSYLSMIGTRQVIETLKNVSRIPGHRVRLYLILPTLYSPNLKQDREILGILQRHFADLVADPIRANTKLVEAPSHRKTIFEYSPRSAASTEYKRLAERVLRDG